MGPGVFTDRICRPLVGWGLPVNRRLPNVMNVLLRLFFTSRRHHDRTRDADDGWSHRRKPGPGCLLRLPGKVNDGPDHRRHNQQVGPLNPLGEPVGKQAGTLSARLEGHRVKPTR